MQKIQILFPEPQMKRLRDISKKEDRPISEIIRQATEMWLERRATHYMSEVKETFPTFNGGKFLARHDRLRTLAYSDRLNLDE